MLDLTLTAARATVDVAGRSILAAAYNGSYVPPTLRVHPGDVVQLRLVNALDDATNLHTHGLSVSQLGNSDNVFLHVPPGGAQDYEIRIPSNHARGLYWYSTRYQSCATCMSTCCCSRTRRSGAGKSCIARSATTPSAR